MSCKVTKGVAVFSLCSDSSGVDPGVKCRGGDDSGGSISLDQILVPKHGVYKFPKASEALPWRHTMDPCAGEIHIMQFLYFVFILARQEAVCMHQTHGMQDVGDSQPEPNVPSIHSFTAMFCFTV